MYGAVSLLDDLTNQMVKDIWQRLEDKCGLKGVRIFPVPHFSWLVAKAVDVEAANRKLMELGKHLPPLQVRTSGLGVFSGPSPVIYIALVNDSAMQAYHHQIWEAVNSLTTQPVPYYAPGYWMPHITLAYGDVTPERLPCALMELCYDCLDRVIHVDTLALVSQEGQEVGDMEASYCMCGTSPLKGQAL